MWSVVPIVRMGYKIPHTSTKTRISGGLGGLYFDQSDFVYQEKEFLGLEKEWLFDMSTEEVVSTWDFTATYTHVLKEVGIGSKFP